ncbi:MAG: hypothetical protein A3G20_05350 [Acidobacteria bacterium RIFCSPLOWO2_12_FULL_59_11]|nr:MAG: hypothetical protein A3G20_05350 [Acidobacteria bacterium RIFCSPLOWO2_12_FULL_59_11]
MTPGKSLLHPLTTLRFAAAAMVVIGHAHVLFGSFNIANAIATGQAVSFFFVLSGFILAYNYPSLPSARDVWMFYATRIARIWPVHVVTAVIFVVAFHSQPPLWHIALNLSLLQAWVPTHDVLLSLNGVSWSLSVELFFYACFPLLIWRWRETWHWKLLVTAGLVITFITIGNIYKLSWDDNAVGVGMLGVLFMNPLARLFEFFLGVCSASLYGAISTQKLSWTTQQASILEIVLLLTVAIALRLCVSIQETLWIGSAGHYYLWREGGALSFAALILVFALERGALSRVLSHPVAVRLGEISFALYLVHTIVLFYFEKWSNQMSADLLWLWCVGYWSVCLAMAYALFVGVEQPMRALILALAKRYVKRESRTAFPPLWTFVKPMTLGGGIVLGMLAAAYAVKPHEPVASPDLASLSQSTIVHATFGDKITLEEFRICSVDALSVELIYSLQPLAKARVSTEKMGIHLLDATGKIMTTLDHAINHRQPVVEQSTLWLQQVRFPAARLKDIDRLGFAMYTDVKDLYPIRGAGTTDWGGKRLIVPIPPDWKRNCKL